MFRHYDDEPEGKNVTMPEQAWLAERFEENRSRLRGVAYRMLGSLSEADDAVQEAWLRLSSMDRSAIENLGGWLTTVVARVCLDMLRSRSSRREEPLEPNSPEPAADRMKPTDPEQEAQLAESVGIALLVVLEKLEPAERLAFVLHDMFAVPFDEIASIVGRSEAAARQLASRARRRVHGPAISTSELTSQRRVVDAFLAALRGGDFEGLLAVLDPDVVVRAESAEGVREVRGARAWARGAIAFSRHVRFAQPALVDGAVGVVLAPRGRLLRALRFRIAGEKIVEAEVVVNPERLRQLDLAVLND
ncbi:MAG TPA: sigma-70 family RNA polymerase sigma factor [Candidatus Acidoferrales bacterium]|nr:sigma-70 family RNA polymerase sigma factor [Candidatus Acidoferrales bacterium]